MISLLSICDEPEVLSVFRLIKIALQMIRVIVPIFLIVSIALSYLKAVSTNNQDMVRKTLKESVTKAIAAVLIFFVPTFVNVIISSVSYDETYKSCLNNATTENIRVAYDLRAEYLVNMAQENYTNNLYVQALRAVRKVSDGNKKGQFEKILEEVKKVIEAKDLVAIVRSSKDKKDYQRALDAVENLEQEDIKEELLAELERIAATMAKDNSQHSSPGYIENPLGIPYYNQCDSRWGNLQYDIGGGPNGPATLCSSSCGYTSLAMVIAGLSHNMSITPVTTVETIRGISIAAGQKTTRGYGAASTGELVRNSLLSQNGITASSISTSFDSIMSAINSNKVVIILVPGHYMVLAPSSTGGVTLLDPFTGWADSRKVSGSYSIEYVSSVYGGINWAAAYSGY